MKNIISLALIAISIFGGLLFLDSQPAFAQLGETLKGPVDDIATGAGLGETETDLPTMIGNIIGIVLGLLGVVLVVIIVYAGFLWMTSGGDNKQAEKAQTWIKNAVIGLFIIIAAYAITNFVIDQLVVAVE